MTTPNCASGSETVEYLRPGRSGAEAAARQGAQGQRRDRGDDRRRRQRRPGPEGRAHRRRHGRAGHDVAAKPPRSCCSTTISPPSWTRCEWAGVRQHQKGDGLYLCHPRADRRHVADPGAFGWPLILLPVHIVFLELIIDPACSVVFEAESRGGGRDEPAAGEAGRAPVQQGDRGAEFAPGPQRSGDRPGRFYHYPIAVALPGLHRMERDLAARFRPGR